MRSSLALLACLASLASCAKDSRCSLDNCKTAFTVCQEQLAAEPSYSVCVDKAGLPATDFDVSSYCPDACEADQGGGILACLADNKATCATGLGGRSQAALVCADATWPLESTCVDRCTKDRVSCDHACPGTDFRACMDCSARCGLELARCKQACPFASARL